MLRHTANEIRKQTIQCIGELGVGHIGGCLSLAEVLAVLYFDVMNIDPADPKKPDRDRFVLSKGHGGPAVYAALALRGYFGLDCLATLNRPNTNLPSHCDMRRTPGIDMTTGSLGQGFSAAVGMALAGALDKNPAVIYTIIGDGESQEGQVWETMLIAPNKGVKNFIVLLDNNRQQLDDFTDKISPLGDMRRKAEDFGWFALDVDGHDVKAIDDAIEACKASDKPGFINMNTIKGKGWPAKEAVNGNHAFRGAAFAGVDEVIENLRRELAALN